MPTTLIAHSAAIGLGQMAIELCRNLEAIDSVVLLDFSEDYQCLNFDQFNLLARANVDDVYKLAPLLSRLASDKKRKFLFLERSRGLARFTPKSSNYLIPMWEQLVWRSEIPFFQHMVSITQHTFDFLQSHGVHSVLLDWPIQIQERIPVENQVRVILHNAGTFGGDYRKGTPEAVRIFQEADIDKERIKLRVTAWRKPSLDLVKLIEENPTGIDLQIGYVNSLADLYSHSDLLLYPSRVEGHPLPLLESFSFGIPALFTNVAPMNEYDPDENYQLPVKRSKGLRHYCDITQGAKILEKAVLMDNRMKSEQVHKIVRERLSWNNLKIIYEELFS